MGFLLSKLLPLFVYPLGLGLLLQLAGLGTAARGRKRLGLGLSGAGLGLVWLFAMPFTSRQLIWGLEERAAALTPAEIPTADAVVVLGGEASGRPWRHGGGWRWPRGVIACSPACACCGRTRRRCWWKAAAV